MPNSPDDNTWTAYRITDGPYQGKTMKVRHALAPMEAVNIAPHETDFMQLTIAQPTDYVCELDGDQDTMSSVHFDELIKQGVLVPVSENNSNDGG